MAGSDAAAVDLTAEERRELLRKYLASRVGEKDGQRRYKMNACETYFAILKGYTTISLFGLPIGFKYGGWLFSPCVLIFSCFIEGTLAIRLCQVAHQC